MVMTEEPDEVVGQDDVSIVGGTCDCVVDVAPGMMIGHWGTVERGDGVLSGEDGKEHSPDERNSGLECSDCSEYESDGGRWD